MFKYSRNVFYYETDKMGVVHHSNYLRWMEEARTAFMIEIGLPYEKMEEANIMSPVVSANLNYKKPFKFGDVFEVRIKVEDYTGVRYKVAYEICCGGEIHATAHSEHCFIVDGRAVSLKRQNLEMHNIFEKSTLQY